MTASDHAIYRPVGFWLLQFQVCCYFPVSWFRLSGLFFLFDFGNGCLVLSLFPMSRQLSHLCDCSVCLDVFHMFQCI